MKPTTLALAALAMLIVPAAGLAQLPPENVVLLKNLDRGEEYSGNWGYTSPTGIELAISGTESGTTFIDASDPVNAHEVGFIPGPHSIWREMATYGHYCYIVTEGQGAALQVVDLADPLNPSLVATLNPPQFFYATAHEIKVDQQTGYCYVAGTNAGLIILDLNANPTNPPLRGTWNVNYVHDLSLKNGKAYCASIYDGIVYVLDVSQPGTPPILGQWTYPNAFTHNTWPTADAHYLVTTDENTGGHLRMWDISNLAQVSQTDEYIPLSGSIVHNAYLRGRYCFMSYYLDGLRVVDAADPNNLVSVGSYDTSPLSGPDYDGAWGCYCFAADPRIVYISDISTGTYILRFDAPGGTAVEEPADGPTALHPVFLGNFPNPFHPSTEIRFELAEHSPVKLGVFDAAGRAVRLLVDGSLQAGRQSVAWDGRDDSARPVASGVYFYRLETPGFSDSRRMILAR